MKIVSKQQKIIESNLCSYIRKLFMI